MPKSAAVVYFQTLTTLFNLYGIKEIILVTLDVFEPMKFPLPQDWCILATDHFKACAATN